MLAVQRAFGLLFLVIGLAAFAESVAFGGGSVGYLAAAVFTALGVLRLRAARRPGE
jgi:hypothetical protein